MLYMVLLIIRALTVSTDFSSTFCSKLDTYSAYLERLFAKSTFATEPLYYFSVTSIYIVQIHTLKTPLHCPDNATNVAKFYKLPIDMRKRKPCL